MPALLPGTHHHQLHAMLQQSRKRTTYHGKQVISNPLTILRHCNAGSSARYSSSPIACHASAVQKADHLSWQAGHKQSTDNIEALQCRLFYQVIIITNCMPCFSNPESGPLIMASRS